MAFFLDNTRSGGPGTVSWHGEWNQHKAQQKIDRDTWVVQLLGHLENIVINTEPTLEELAQWEEAGWGSLAEFLRFTYMVKGASYVHDVAAEKRLCLREDHVAAINEVQHQPGGHRKYDERYEEAVARNRDSAKTAPMSMTPWEDGTLVKVLREKSLLVDAERSSLAHKKTYLDLEKLALRKEMATISQMRDAVAAQCDAVARKQGQLVRNKVDFMEELSAWTRLKSSLKEGHNVLIIEAETLAKNQVGLDMKKMVLAREEEALQHDAEAMNCEKEALRREKESLFRENNAVRREKESLFREKDVVRREKENLFHEKESLVRMKDAVRHEKQAMVQREKRAVSSMGKIHSALVQYEDIFRQYSPSRFLDVTGARMAWTSSLNPPHSSSSNVGAITAPTIGPVSGTRCTNAILTGQEEIYSSDPDSDDSYIVTPGSSNGGGGSLQETDEPLTD